MTRVSILGRSFAKLQVENRADAEFKVFESTIVYAGVTTV